MHTYMMAVCDFHLRIPRIGTSA